MKTAAEILKEYEKVTIDPKQWPNGYPYVEEAMKEYAKQAIEEQLKVAAKEATTMEASDYNSDGIGYEYWIADPKSILNCTRIELK